MTASLTEAGSRLPEPADVSAAAAELSGLVLTTPVLRSPALDRLAGARLWLKAENLQWGGSYKLRGATLAVDRIARDGRAPGVLAQSTGNHAVAVALAARSRRLPAIVVLPVTTSPAKVARARSAGAQVVLIGRSMEEGRATVERLRAETGYAVIDAFDHADVVAGQGTATLELIEQAWHQGAVLDTLVIPVGGGGGIAGACLAAFGSGAAVVGVEPVGCDSLAQSLKQRRPVRVEPAATLADGLRPAAVGRIPFAVARTGVEEMITVDDDAIGTALCLLLFQAGVLVEPSAAAALAGALKVAARRPGTDIGVLLTGGNVEPAMIARLIDRYGAAAAVLGSAPVAA